MEPIDKATQPHPADSPLTGLGQQPGQQPGQQQPGQPENRYPVEFRGSGGEYFKIWIVNVLLSFITLYIYSAWAKVRTKRYFYGNTFVDNSSFEYHATGGQILKGRIIALVVLLLLGVASAFFPLIHGVFLLLLLLLLPWIIWRSIIFNARMSSYRNVRYGFTKRVGELYLSLLKPILIFVVITAILVIVAYLARDLILGLESDVAKAVIGASVFLWIILAVIFFPWLHRNLSQFALNGYRYGTARFSSDLSLRKYVWFYLGSVLLAIVLFLLVVAAIALAGFFVQGGLAAGASADEFMEKIAAAHEPGSPHYALAIVLIIFGYLFLLFLSMIPAAYLRSKLRNYRYAQTIVGNQVRAHSSLKTWPFALLLFTNILLLVITLGLAYPWTKVRVARYITRNTVVVSQGTLDNFVAAEEQRVSSLGDELGEAFDFDFEIGV